MVYEKLSSALGEDEQILYRQRCEELAPSLRYCAYNIGDETAIDDLMTLRSQAHGEILENLDVSSIWTYSNIFIQMMLLLLRTVSEIKNFETVKSCVMTFTCLKCFVVH